MKHFILLLIVLALHAEGFGQHSPFESGNPGGWESALNLDVKSNEQLIRFENVADYSASKTLPGYFQISVRAPRIAQWVITASLADVYSHTNPQSDKFANLVYLKVAGGQTFLISSKPQVIIQSNNNIQHNQYSIDLVVDPPFNMSAGTLPGLINFRLELL